MNEESAEVLIKKNRRRIFDAETFVQFNQGQVFVGIDVIGEYLTEINVTSPTGIQELERFDNVNIAEMIWHAVEEKLKN